MGMFNQFKVADRPKLADAVHKFLIREVKHFKAQSGFSGISFDLRVEDADDPMLEGEQVKMVLPVFPDMTPDELESKAATWQKWFWQCMANYEKVMSALGVKEDEMDDPDLTAFAGLYITAYGKTKTNNLGVDEFVISQNTVKIAD